MSSTKGEKSEKSIKLHRERSKGSKDKDLIVDSASDGPKSDSDASRSISPRNKKKRSDAITPSSVRFEASESARLGIHQKLQSRSSSAGPIASSSEPDTKTESQDEVEEMMEMFRTFSTRMNANLTNVTRKNQDLKSQVSLLLRAAQTDEPPFEALVREKESLSREYDQLRYEHQVLQKEFQQIRRENLDLIATTQELQAELAALKAGAPQSAATTPEIVLEDLPRTSSASSISPRRGKNSSSSLASNERATYVSASTTSCVSPPSIAIKRRDNVAELEQSILELEEEIRSPRGLSGSTSTEGSSNPAPQTPEQGESTPPSTSSKKRKVVKSRSNEWPDAQAVVSVTPPSPDTPADGPGRTKGPPERTISAPNSTKKSAITSAVNTGTAQAPTTGMVSSPSTSSTASSNTAGSSRNNPSPTNTTKAKPIAQSKSAANEEQRLNKYLAGPRRPASGNKASNSEPPSPNHLTSLEQAYFTQIFRKWDNNDDDLIDRHELELSIETMSQHEYLRELYLTVRPHWSKITWETLNIGRYTQLPLSAALAFLSDSKVGTPNPLVFTKQ